MAKTISLFSHKGGVSKTTTCFHLGWMLAKKGYRVLMVDADPQCNLTGLIMDFRGPEEFDDFYEKSSDRNIRAGLAPAFESQPRAIEAVECLPVEGVDNLFLLPGHIQLSEYDTTLNLAQELSGSVTALKNVPGSISYLIQKTADKIGADFVLIDMNPGLSPMNQNLVLTSDYFIVPTSPDYFSVMAINSMAAFLPRWKSWYENAVAHPVLKTADYKLPKKHSEFLGYLIQNYRTREGRGTSAFEKWIKEITRAVEKNLIPALSKVGMATSLERHKKDYIKSIGCLGKIPSFNSLMAVSHEKKKPVFALSKEDVEQRGKVWSTTEGRIEDFEKTYDEMAEVVIAVCEIKQ